MPRPVLIAALVVALAASTLAATARPGSESLLQRGALPNGFRYAVLPRTNEPGRISLRLIVHAGALDERDDERGFAHFVEHMAFNGTTHYPPGKLVPFFERLGLAWGADANAETSFTSTIYKLDLPAGQAAHLAEAIQVLADFAGGMEFHSPEVRRERGVILSEIGARDTNELHLRERNIAIYYAGTALPTRAPLGDAASVEHAGASGLRRFYERCYRPERMTLLVVGDIADKPLRKLIGENFAPLRAHGPAAAQILPGPPAAGRPVAADVIVSPSATASNVTLLSLSPVGPDTTATIQDTLGAGAVIGLLNQRLAVRRATMPDRIGLADAFIGEGVDLRYVHYGLEASATFADWPAALGVVETELRRAREQGFTAAEVGETSAALLAGLRANAAGFAGDTADQLAGNIAGILAAGRTWHSPAEILAIAEDYFARFTPAAALARLQAILPDDRRHVVLFSRAAPDGGSDAVLAAYRASAVQPLAAAAKDDTVLHFPYDDFGPPGRVAGRISDPALAVELVRFANGARLNLRSDPVEPQRFRLWARLGRGTADVPRDRPGMSMLAVGLMSRCDLGRLTREDLHRLTGLNAVDGNWSFDGNDFIIQLTGPTAALPFAFRSLAAYLSDLKLEPARLHEAVSVYASLAGGIFASTAGYAKADTMYYASGEDPRFRLPPLAEIERYPFAEVSAWLRTHWLEGPLEIGLAGDFTADTAIADAASTVGALPPRRDPPPLASERLALLTQPYRHLSYVDLPDQTAAVRLFWPIRDAADLRVFRATRVAAAAFADRLRVKLREDLGVTYSPSGSVYREPTQPDFGLAFVELTFPPATALKLAEHVIKLADAFARHGLTAEEFARAREPLRAAALADLRSNEWWLAAVLVRAQSQPAVLAEARTHGTAFDDLTRADVDRAAAGHFRSAASNAVGAIPQAAPAAKPR